VINNNYNDEYLDDEDEKVVVEKWSWKGKWISLT